MTPGPLQPARHKGEKQSFSTFGFPPGLMISYSSFIGSRCATIWACVIFIEGDERTLKSDNIYCVGQIPYRHCDTALALFTKLLQIGGHPLLSAAGEKGQYCVICIQSNGNPQTLIFAVVILHEYIILFLQMVRTISPFSCNIIVLTV